MGTGTTMLAAERASRVTFGAEIDPGYRSGYRSVESDDGRQVVLARTSHTFSQTALARAQESAIARAAE